MIAGIVIGLFVGVVLGAFIMACFIAGSRADDVLAQIEPMPYWEIKYHPETNTFQRQEADDDLKVRRIVSMIDGFAWNYRELDDD